MTRSPAATRAYESAATLSCGLITIPLAVYTSTVSSHGIKRKEFTKDGHPVGRALLDKETNQVVTSDQVVRKIETEHGFVHVEDHEIEKLFTITPKTLTVKAFQPQHLFYSGAYVPKAPYCVEVPKQKIGSKKVPNAAGEQALALLLGAMEAENALAFVEFTTRGVPKPAVLLPNGQLWLVYHEDELREQRPLPQFDVPEALLQQGVSLVKAFWQDDPVDTTDERTALIQGFADEKAAAGDFDKPEEEAAAEQAPVAPVTDLAALLAASVQAAKAA